MRRCVRFHERAGYAPPGVTGQLGRLAYESGLSPGSVTSLIAVARAEAPAAFARYFERKAGLLGVGRLSIPDTPAPVPGVRRSYRRALRETLRAFRGFSPAMADAAARVAAEGHISARAAAVRFAAEENPYPFCSMSGPGGVPFVRASWNRLSGDPLSLAHELGHAAHTALTGDRRSLTGPEWATLEETAATFAEDLVARRLIAGAGTGKARRGLICAWLDGICNDVLEVAFDTLFELEARDADREGRWPEDLSGLYALLLAEGYGDAVHVPPEARWIWIQNDRFFSGGFCGFRYLFARLLSLALDGIRGREGEAFARRYTAMLAATGTACLEDLLADAGIGPLDEAFWRRGFDGIRRIVDML
jgi:oligoendopeptidase F